MRQIVAAVLCGFFLNAPAHADELFHTPPHCWQEARIFHLPADEGPFMEVVPEHIKMERMVGSMPGGAILSPNRAYSFHVQEVVKDGPVDVTILIYNERPYLLRHAITGVNAVRDVKWVNEKTIYYRVWLGRMGGVDVLYDVESEKVIEYQLFQYGSIAFQQFQQCKDKENPVPEACTPCPWEVK